jgi:plastocyanin
VGVGALALDPIRREPSRPAAAVAAATPTTAVPTTAARSGRRTTVPAATPSTPAVAAASMTVKGFKFADTVSAAPGATVTVTNGDSSDHTVTAKDGSFGIPLPADGQNSFVAPTAPGTYSFYCQIHPGMTGKLVVG